MGGKRFLEVPLIYFDEKIPTINAESLFRNMCCYCVDKYGSDHYKRKIKEFTNINHIIYITIYFPKSFPKTDWQ